MNLTLISFYPEKLVNCQIYVLLFKVYFLISENLHTLYLQRYKINTLSFAKKLPVKYL